MVSVERLADNQVEKPAEKHHCAPENAAKMLMWIRERGGIAIWRSVNLSNPGASWSTPVNHEDGTPGGRPTWQADSAPCRVISDPSEVEVVTAREVKRFHVGVRRGDQGLSLKVTDGGSRRIRSEVAKAGEEAWHEFDYGTQEAVILVPGEKVSLLEWEAREAQRHDSEEKTVSKARG